MIGGCHTKKFCHGNKCLKNGMLLHEVKKIEMNLRIAKLSKITSKTIMLHPMALVTFSFNKIVGSLFHLLVTDGKNHVAQDTSARMVKNSIYIRNSINNLSCLSYHFLTYDSVRKNLLLTVSLLQLQIKKTSKYVNKRG